MLGIRRWVPSALQLQSQTTTTTMATAAQNEGRVRVENLESGMNQLNVDFAIFKTQLEEQRINMIDEVQKGFANGQNDMGQVLQAASNGFEVLKKEIEVVVSGAREEFKKMNDNFNNLYTDANSAVVELKGRLDLLEANGGQGIGGAQGYGDKGQRGYLPTKNTIPKTFDHKLEEWRQWKDDVLDFFDENNKGMREFLVEVQKEDVVDEAWIQNRARQLGNKIAGNDEAIRIWRALKGMTTGEARKVINTVKEENGFMAWVALHQRFEPGLAIQQGMVLADFSGMVAKPAKTPSETRDLMTEIQRKMKNIEDVTGEKISDSHAKSVMIGVLDPISRQHTAMYQGATTGPLSFMRKVMEFVNNITGTNPDAMQIGSLGEQAGASPEHRHEQQGQEEAWDYGGQWPWGSPDTEGTINGLKGNKGGGKGVQCYNCGEFGHIARNCPKPPKQKGDGKGKGYGDQHGKGYQGQGQFKGSHGNFGPSKGYGQKGAGKGPRGGCWICGGNHYQKDCPRNGGKGGFRTLDGWESQEQQGMQSGVKPLACLTTCEPGSPTPSPRIVDLTPGYGVEDEYVGMVDLVDSSDSEVGEVEEQESESGDEDNNEKFDSIQNLLIELAKNIQEQKKSGKKKKGKKNAKDDDNIVEFELVTTKRQRKREKQRQRRQEKKIKDNMDEMMMNNMAIKHMHNIMDEQNGIKETDDIGNNVESIVDEQSGTKETDNIGNSKQNIINYKDDKKELKILQIVEPEGFNAVGEAQPEWQEIEFAVDSGATESVINEDMLPAIPLTESEASKRGVKYEVANGVRIPNLGQKQFDGITDDESLRNIKVQVCDVNKALLSVKKVLNAGNRVVFDGEGSYIEDKSTGEKMWLREEGGMYMLRMWVKNPFQRPGQ